MNTDTILVTGVGGLIGSAVAKRLAGEGRSIVGMDRQIPSDASYPVLTQELPEPHRWHEAIVKYGVRRVVHAGGVSGPMLLRDAPARIIDVNVNGVAGLLESARVHQLDRIVCFSSIMAYGDHPGLSLVTEEALLKALTVYGATKAAGDALIAAFHSEYGVDAVSLRIAGCYGPGRTTPCVIRALLENALNGRTTSIRNDPTRTRQYVFIDDVVDAVCSALDAEVLGQRTYNIGPGVAQTLTEVVSAVRESLPGVTVQEHPDGLAWNTFGVGPLDITAARRDLGFEPRTGLPDGVAKTLAWLREKAIHGARS